jgi:hypothetical protein
MGFCARKFWGVLEWEIAPLMEEVEYAVGVHVFEAGVRRVRLFLVGRRMLRTGVTLRTRRDGEG